MAMFVMALFLDGNIIDGNGFFYAGRISRYLRHETYKKRSFSAFSEIS